MRVGFLVWNQFQVAHTAEIARHFNEPDFIFIDREPSALRNFDPTWLVKYGAYARFVSELDLCSLDGQYDAIIAQFRPPLKAAWSKTKLIIQQYSLAKPKTAYNARWFAADHGLVYGSYSESIIGQMCPVSQVGNPRFDPYFSGGLNEEWVESLRSRLDPQKRTVLYLPTWGDLSQTSSFGSALSQLSDQFNILASPHHLTSIRSKKRAEPPIPGLIDLAGVPSMLDPGLYLMAVADAVISDMSGAIFDALYCGKPVVLLGSEDVSFSQHRKADDSGLEVRQRHRIGPYVTGAESLSSAVQALVRGNPYWEENERLVKECFRQRGGGAELAAAAIRIAVEEQPRKPLLQVYAAPDFSDLLLSRASTAARKRKRSQLKSGKRQAAPGRKFPQKVRRWLRSAIPGSRVAPARARSDSLAALVKKGHFFAAGRKLEGWSKLNQRRRAQLVYQAQSAASALRFSRRLWKKQLAKLFDGSFAPSTSAGRDLLQQIGMLLSAEAWYRKCGVEVPERLSERIDGLGTLAGVLDMAARNEVADPIGQLCITPRGDIRPVQSVDSSNIVEVHLLTSLARDLRDEGQRPYRQSLLQFTRNLVEEAREAGLTVYPRLQTGIAGASTVSRDRAAFTWHTRDCGRDSHYHLKIGSLYGHFIIDDKGYSGWGSIAEVPLAEVTRDVDQLVADKHWEDLCHDLVSGGRSKYSQAEEAVPSDWKGFVFLPMQVADDTVAQLAWIDTLSLLTALIEWAKISGAMVVVKRHPMCRSKEIEGVIEEARNAGYIQVSGANIHNLIARARCVVTVNSGVGAEALLQLRPVITTGRSDYAPATIKARTIEQLYLALEDLESKKVGAAEVRKFLWAYTKRYMVRFDDREAIRDRLGSLLQEKLRGSRHSSDLGLVSVPRIEGTTSIPFVVEETSFEGDCANTATDRTVALGEQCDLLLREFKAARVSCWLDSGSLLGLVRSGRLNAWEKDIDLGIWIDDFAEARAICQNIAEKFSLWYREKWVDGAPQALLLSSHAGQKQTILPISVHTFYRVGGVAWLPQPFSLVGFRAKYPRYVYREANGPNRAPLHRKVVFLLRHPIYSLCIAAEKMGAAKRIGRELKRIEKAETLRERVLMRLFVKMFEWTIPAHYFDELQPVAAHLPHVLVPARVEEYLRERYGDWRVPVKSWFYVVDDGCIGPIARRRLQHSLQAAVEQYRTAAERPVNRLAGEGASGDLVPVAAAAGGVNKRGQCSENAGGAK